MKPMVILTFLLLLAACTDPALTAEFGFGTNGAYATPAVSGNLGGATITVSQ